MRSLLESFESARKGNGMALSIFLIACASVIGMNIGAEMLISVTSSADI